MSISTEWALPGDLDSGTWFGEQFHASFYRLLPGGKEAEPGHADCRSAV